MTLKERKEDMIALRRAGKTYEEIARLFGTSKQYVYIVISDACDRKDPARYLNVDIEKIVYEGIYDLFANDYKMTIAKFARIAFGSKKVTGAQKEKVRRLIYNYGEPRLSIQHLRNISEYIGKPFESVFKVRKEADDEQV